jgi:nucleotide-binding universal stress UspA family protein
MIKDIMLTITQSAGDESAFNYSVNLAESAKAHLAIVIPIEYPDLGPSEFGISSYPMYAGVYEEKIKAAETIAEDLRTKLSSTALSSEVRIISTSHLNASQVSAKHAHYADICVLGGDSEGPRKSECQDIFAELLLQSGRPVLYAPKSQDSCLPIKHVVIAWQPTKEASRAVHDAMPFLLKAKTIDVLIIDPNASNTTHGEEPGAAIALHLARHGLKVRVVVQPKTGQSNGQAILSFAISTEAHLIVAGGYSHSRLREQIMGGVTRELSSNDRIPVLFSH